MLTRRIFVKLLAALPFVNVPKAMTPSGPSENDKLLAELGGDYIVTGSRFIRFGGIWYHAFRNKVMWGVWDNYTDWYKPFKVCKDDMFAFWKIEDDTLYWNGKNGTEIIVRYNLIEEKYNGKAHNKEK